MALGSPVAMADECAGPLLNLKDTFLSTSFSFGQSMLYFRQYHSHTEQAEKKFSKLYKPFSNLHTLTYEY